MTLEKMKEYVDRCIKAYPGHINRLSLTGGECMMLGSDIEEIIKYANRKGLTADLISNGFWGKSYSHAREVMLRLREAGLTSLSFSTGEDHQAGVPLRSVRNAVVAAARTGFIPTLRVESHWGRVKCKPRLDADIPLGRLVKAGRINIEWWSWQHYSNETRKPLRYPTHRRPYDEPTPCHSIGKGDIIITPYGDMLACCGIGCSRSPYLRLGNVEKEPVKTVYERIGQDALKVWLKEKGPVAILKYVYENSDIKFHDVCGDGCRACTEIFRNPRIIPFLRETSHQWQEQLRYAYL